MLRIGYDSTTEEAVLSVETPTPYWTAIRTACESVSEEAQNMSGTELRMPWWAFLACRSAIQAVEAQYAFEILPDEAATKLLLDALQKEESYNSVGTRPPVPEDQILARLRERGFTRELKPYQLRNIAKLCALPAAATFSVPGAGKTTEALAYYYYNQEPGDALLVVAPKNAFPAWDEQLPLCARDEKDGFVRLQGGEPGVARKLQADPHFAIISYHQLYYAVEPLGRFLQSRRTFVFLDESHRMKGGNERKNASAVLSLSHLPVRKLIMSGTPMPNSTVDLVAQFDFLYPGMTATEDTVVDLIRPIYVRTTKKQLGLTKPKYRKTPIPLSPAQEHLYQLLKSEEARQLEGLRAGQTIALRQAGRSVMRLLQLVSNPSLCASIAGFAHPELLEQVREEGGGNKLEYVCRRARQLTKEGHKVVIWSTFIANVEIIAQRLHDLGAVYIHGGVEAGSEEDEETREHRVKKFHDDPYTKILVANPAACSEGISLHQVCHHALYLDRSYNAAHYLQSQDRIHRLGLPPEQDTFIEVVYSPGTIDESVERRLDTKVRRMGEVLDDPDLHVEMPDVKVDDPEDPSLTEDDLQDFMAHLRE